MSFSSSVYPYPYDTVVYITDVMGGITWQGSGVLISPDEVLTASHVVSSSVYGLASDVVVTPAYANGTQPFGSASGTYVHYHPVQDANGLISTDQSQYDYAVIHLSHSFTGLGQMGLDANFSGGAATVTGYPASAGGAMVTSQQSVTVDPSATLLEGTSLGEGSSGGPIWVTGTDGQPYVVGVVSSADLSSGVGYFTQITTNALQQIEAAVAEDDHTSGAVQQLATVAVMDNTTGQVLTTTAQVYPGPVAGLQDQYINVTGDSLNIAVDTPGWFIHSGAGNDAIRVGHGTNVLDGGTGSNFLTGGSGTDTFFVDDRAAPADIWSTVADFHAGDAATIWGVKPGDFDLAWQDGQGASGYTGLTLHASAANRPVASMTLVGFSQADVSDGRLSVSYGTDTASNSAYMYILANA